MKKGVSLLVSFMAVVFLATTVLAAGGPEVIVLHAKKGDVQFQHHKHQERAKCGECHHYQGPDGKQIIDEKAEHAQKCEKCHNKSFHNKKLNKPMKAFHKNCKDCHKKHKAPTKCKACHKK